MICFYWNDVDLKLQTVEHGSLLHLNYCSNVESCEHFDWGTNTWRDMSDSDVCQQNTSTIDMSKVQKGHLLRLTTRYQTRTNSLNPTTDTQRTCLQFIFVTDMQEVPTKARLLGQFLQLASLCERIRVEDVKISELKWHTILDNMDIMNSRHLNEKLLALHTPAHPPAPNEMREDLKQLRHSLTGLKICAFIQFNSNNMALLSQIQSNAEKLFDDYDIFLRRHNQMSVDMFWPDDWLPESLSNPYVIKLNITTSMPSEKTH